MHIAEADRNRKTPNKIIAKAKRPICLAGIVNSFDARPSSFEEKLVPVNKKLKYLLGNKSNVARR